MRSSHATTGCEALTPRPQYQGNIAGVSIMLASKAGAFITGQIIPVDGGDSVIN
jgi:NAD(P)-dependent dehydrogenase (short-subunit alcohol dehydrogenase family)